MAFKDNNGNYLIETNWTAQVTDDVTDALNDLSSRIGDIEEVATTTDDHDHDCQLADNRLRGLLVGHLRTVHQHVYFTHGAFETSVSLSGLPFTFINDTGVKEQGGCGALTSLYRGGTTTVTAWVTDNKGDTYSIPIEIDNSGIKLTRIPNNISNITLPAGSIISFQASLALLPT